MNPRCLHCKNASISVGNKRKPQAVQADQSLPLWLTCCISAALTCSYILKEEHIRSAEPQSLCDALM